MLERSTWDEEVEGRGIVSFVSAAVEGVIDVSGWGWWRMWASVVTAEAATKGMSDIFFYLNSVGS